MTAKRRYDYRVTLEGVSKDKPAASEEELNDFRIFDTLIFKLNERFWVDELALSERDLIQMTGLKKTTLHDAKQFLASRHIIKCTPFKNKTSYRLGEKMQELLDRPIPDH